jgi:hypothetical protein
MSQMMTDGSSTQKRDPTPTRDMDEPLGFEVVGFVAEALDNEEFGSLLQAVRDRFRRVPNSRRVSFVFHERPRAVEFSCDATDRDAVCAWLRSRSEITDLQVDPVP